MSSSSSSSSSSSCTRIASSFALILLLLCLGASSAFTAPKMKKSPGAGVSSCRSSRFMGQTMTFTPKIAPSRQRRTSSSTSSLSMFLGTDGGILGVGTPEVFTILLVGYFVLGPSDLYKLVKEIGKFIQNIRSLGTEATKSFESTMETQLAVEDLRKAQRELNDAFSFRRSINVDQDSDKFTTVDEARPGIEPMIGSKPTTAISSTDATQDNEAMENAGTSKPKKRIRRRKKKIVPLAEEQEQEEQLSNGEYSGTIPDLDMSSAFDEPSATVATTDGEESTETDQAMRSERMERLARGQPTPKQEEGDSASSLDWFLDKSSTATGSEDGLPNDAEAANRFATQLSGNWNDSILENEDALSPLASIMEKLALLEEERAAADARLQEEFQLRTELEEKYYRRKRAILEDAAVEVQADAYKNLSTSTRSSSSSAGGGGAATATTTATSPDE